MDEAAVEEEEEAKVEAIGAGTKVEVTEEDAVDEVVVAVVEEEGTRDRTTKAT